MKPIYLIIIASILLVGCQNNGESKKPRLRFSQKTTHNIKEDQRYEFGYLEVPENRNDPNSKFIEIPFYIFKSRNDNPKKDPIIYTVGGPGETTMPSAQYMKSYEYLDDRDFILIEQRGNDYAKPHLDCPEWAKAVYESNLPNFDKTELDSHFEKAAQLCKDRLETDGVDLNGYNTLEIAADINDLVELLDIEQYNLLTISYSTKIAQVLMRDYPDRIRSVVMDSPLPLEVNYDEESVNNLLVTLNSLLLNCEKDPNCNARYPNLIERFDQYLLEKTRNPLSIEVTNPKNGKKENYTLKGKDIIQYFGAISTSSAPYIPSEIHKLLNEDYSTLIAQLEYNFEGPSSGSGIGMRLSVWCSEELPFNSAEKIKKETTKYASVEGLSPALFSTNVCKIWGVDQMDSKENQPVKSNIPTLLINGEYDPQTPSKWASNMKKNLTESHHIIFKGWSHTPTTYWSNSCGMKTARQFFNNPYDRPEPDCLPQLERINFK